MICSPLRYPGGKSKLFPFFSNLISKNDLYNSSYCEPYAGGAGLAIRLLVSGFVERISINDIDLSIYSFWMSILTRADEFCAMIEDTPINVDEWYRQKEVWSNGSSEDILKLGFAAYFLNRTNRSGIIEGAGPIGGYSQSGEWKIDARFVKPKQISNILALSRFASQIEVSNVDALEYIESRIGRPETLLYLDPPYFVKGQKLYKNFYKPEDHVIIAEVLTVNRSARWVVSYDDVPEIRRVYSEFSPISYYLNYSAGPKAIGSEVIFLSDAILPPQMRSAGSDGGARLVQALE